MTDAEGWEALVARLEPHVSPEWSRHARTYGAQGWVRLVALVDAHHQLSNPMIAEKIAMTMGDLAVDRDAEQAGWTAITERARDERRMLLERVVEEAPGLLPDDLVPLFARSLSPIPPS